MWTSLATFEISLAMSIPLAPNPTTTTLCGARVNQTGNNQVLLQPARNKRQRREAPDREMVLERDSCGCAFAFPATCRFL
jgi:hypothetical protein